MWRNRLLKNFSAAARAAAPPLPGHQTKSERRHPKRYGPRLPRWLSQPQQDLRQARHRLLGLPRRAACHPKPAGGPILAHHCPAPLRFRLTADTFAAITFLVRKFLKHQGYAPNLSAPNTFNEKVLHKMLFDQG